MTRMRIGLGYDVHPFTEGRPLRLAGVEIPHSRGLAGHSDGDAVCHAVADALLGALALGDLGSRFPDTDPRWKGADSGELLRRVAEEIEEHDARIENLDVIIVADEPRLAPHLPAMRERLASILRLELEAVSIKPKRTEGVALGGGRGLAVQAAALLVQGNPKPAQRGA